MRRWLYHDSIRGFLEAEDRLILGELAKNNDFPLEPTQRDAWQTEINVLQKVLEPYQGNIFFEYSIPRMGRRVDVVVLIGGVIFVIEFKVGNRLFERADIDQVWDYALDIKNFHEPSHNRLLAPIVVATEAEDSEMVMGLSVHNDKTLCPVRTNPRLLGNAISEILRVRDGESVDAATWAAGRYCPTPTIIEAATALYNNHSVAEISRNDAGAINLTETSQTIAEIIRTAKEQSKKCVCFVTGVPGAGKTLVGLNIATTHFDRTTDLYSVFLSGNGPLVKVLREALVRDKVAREREQGRRLTKADARSEVKMFIQNVHNFRDDCLFDEERPPIEHVALFDEAQRAWNRQQTANFMARKRRRPNFDRSEPEFLISCLDRHPDWAVIVCLVGGGQEINTGEAGITEWVRALKESFPSWEVWVSGQLTDSEYGAGAILTELEKRQDVVYNDKRHLSVSMRSFRAEKVSLLVKQVLDCEAREAAETLRGLENYPIVITRDLATGKKWLRSNARGSERYGIVVSSKAERLRPHAIDIRPDIDPVHWFLNGKEDVRSSYYLEDVATEFHVQGLELDWTCVTWDADFRYSDSNWTYQSFHGNRWKNINKEVNRVYLKNAYRVLLTRARQGMVIVVPSGDASDPTRLPEFYNPTYEYLKAVGFPEV